MADRANIAPAEVLYRSRTDDAHHRVYTHRSEEAVLSVGDTQIERPFIQQESYDELRRSNMQYIHLGVIQVRIQVLQFTSVFWNSPYERAYCGLLAYCLLTSFVLPIPSGLINKPSNNSK